MSISEPEKSGIAAGEIGADAVPGELYSGAFLLLSQSQSVRDIRRDHGAVVLINVCGGLYRLASTCTETLPSAEAEEMSPRARDTPRVRPKRCLIDFLMKMLLSDRSLDLCCLNKKWRDINKLYHG